MQINLNSNSSLNIIRVSFNEQFALNPNLFYSYI